MNEEEISIYIGRYIHTIKYNSALKNKEILPFVTPCMNLEGLSEISQTQKDKNYRVSFICETNKKTLTQKNTEENGGPCGGWGQGK